MKKKNDPWDLKKVTHVSLRKPNPELLLSIKNLFYDPHLMPNEDMAELLLCRTSKDIKSRSELEFYLEDRLAELINKSEHDLIYLEKLVYDLLNMENPFIESERDLARLILESPHYRVVLNSEPSEPVETLTTDEVVSLFLNTSIEGLLMTLNECF